MLLTKCIRHYLLRYAPPLLFPQAPVFISMFVGLRRCANLPVMSMTTGGALWLTDLTVADPYYLLPVMTCCTMYATIVVSTCTTCCIMYAPHRGEYLHYLLHHVRHHRGEYLLHTMYATIMVRTCTSCCTMHVTMVVSTCTICCIMYAASLRVPALFAAP